MKIGEAIQQLPEDQRPLVVAELQKATSVEDLEAIAKRYDLDINAQAVYDRFSSTEVDEEDLKKVAGGCECGVTTCGCGTISW